MKLIWFFVLAVFFLVPDKKGCSDSGGGFSIKLYSKGGELNYVIEESSLLCVDWAHQSFLVSDEVKNSLIYNRELFGGEMVVELEGETIYHADIISDDANYEDGKPKLIFQGDGIFFLKDNWIFVRYLKNNVEYVEGELPYFKELLNERLFNYLKEKKKLDCKDWGGRDGYSKEVVNELDLEPQETAKRVFGQE